MVSSRGVRSPDGGSFVALKITERYVSGHPSWFVNGVVSKLNDVSFLLWAPSLGGIVYIIKSGRHLLEARPGPLVLPRIWPWIALRLFGWAVYVLSIATMPDPGTFLRATLDQKIRIIQTCEGLVNLIAIATVYFYVYIGWCVSRELGALPHPLTYVASHHAHRGCADLRRSATIIITVNGGLTAIYVWLEGTSIREGFKQGNWVLGVVL